MRYITRRGKLNLAVFVLLVLLLLVLSTWLTEPLIANVLGSAVDGWTLYIRNLIAWWGGCRVPGARK
jgi:hypothetical protein